jgi:hypothetical protein
VGDGAKRVTVMGNLSDDWLDPVSQGGQFVHIARMPPLCPWHANNFLTCTWLVVGPPTCPIFLISSN